MAITRAPTCCSSRRGSEREPFARFAGMPVMRRPCAGLLALAVAASPMASGAESGDESLVGLWAAKRFFGPDVRGELVLVPRDGAVVAEIAGFSAPVKVARGGEHLFELPDGRGSFRGKVAASGDEIAGFWVQPASPLSGLPYSSPVKLRKVADTWRG